MNWKNNLLLGAFASIIYLTGCDKQTTPEALQIQKPHSYSEEYLENLRAYKKTEHQIAYVWFADYTQSYSYGQRFAGLPDSIDICSLWGGIPNEEINPTAYREMREIQEVKGVRLVIPTIVRIEDKVRYGDEEFYRLFQESYEKPYDLEKRTKAIHMYADILLKEMWDNDVDGLDLDYEPEGDRLTGDNFNIFVSYLGGFIGPKSANPEKLLVLDFYSNTPPKETEPYVSYYVRQSYNASSARTLQNQFRSLSEWCPPGKFIVTENIGDNWQNGGVAFTDVDGNKVNDMGEPLYSLEGMALWNPTEGAKGGFGAFYVQRDYNSTPPYKHLRKGIQIQNPAKK